MFDSAMLAAYFDRVGIPAPRRPTLHTLRRVHRAHVAAMPYENLDIQLGRPIRLDAASLHAKLVEGGRGGYCYEHNGVLAFVLEAMGFDVRRVLGGVARETEGDKNWWNHMPLVVRFGKPGNAERSGEDAGHSAANGERGGDKDKRVGVVTEYLADAGIGVGFRDPLPIRNGSYRVGSFNFGMWSLGGDEWRCSIDPRVANLTFDFRLPERQPEEFADRCRELSTSPDSPFVKTLTVQNPDEHDMWVLRARTLTVYDPALPDFKSVRVVEDDDAFATLLRGRFNLTLPDADIAALWVKAEEQHEQKLAEESKASAV